MYRDELNAFECWFTLLGGVLIGALLLPAGLGVYYLAIADEGNMTVRAIETRRAIHDSPVNAVATTTRLASQGWAWANASDQPASPIETGYTAQPVEGRPQQYALLASTPSKRRRQTGKALAVGWITSAVRLLLLVPFAALCLGFAAFAALSGAMSEHLPDRRTSTPEGLALLWSIFFAPHVETAGGPDPERHAERTTALSQFDAPPEPVMPAQPQEKPRLTDFQRATIDTVKERLALLETGWHRVEFVTSGMSPAGKAALTKLVRAGVLPYFGIEVADNGREFRREAP
jgi:hypothetical protein